MFGKGLLKGLGITWKEFWSKKFTVQYPEWQHPKPERFHGKFALDVDKCIACNLCANACPNKVIQIDTAKAGKKKYLTKYVMNIQYCLFCGMCVEACNRGALRYTKEHDMVQYNYEALPLVLVEREAPQEEAEQESKAEAGDKAKGQDKAKKKEQEKAPAASADKEAGDEVAAGKAPDKEGQ